MTWKNTFLSFSFFSSFLNLLTSEGASPFFTVFFLSAADVKSTSFCTITEVKQFELYQFQFHKTLWRVVRAAVEQFGHKAYMVAQGHRKFGPEADLIIPPNYQSKPQHMETSNPNSYTTSFSCVFLCSSSDTEWTNHLNVNATWEHLRSKGAVASKTVLGVPLYGRSFFLKNSTQHGIGAPALNMTFKVSLF